MSRVSRARKVAAAAAYGGGGLTALGALGLGVITAEVKLARHVCSDHITLDQIARAYAKELDANTCIA